MVDVEDGVVQMTDMDLCVQVCLLGQVVGGNGQLSE